MPATRQAAHVIDPVYATPVLRAPSPAESINTEYGQDDTSVADAATDDETFERQVEEQIGLRRTTWAEAADPPKPIILHRPPRDSREEQMQFEDAMKILRRKVTELEDEEIFDNVVQRNPGPAYIPPDPSPQDVEAIMRSMLPPSSRPPQNTALRPGSLAPSYPSTMSAHTQVANGQSSGTTFTGSRYGNLGRNQ